MAQKGGRVMQTVPGVTKVAIRRSVEAKGRAAISRRGQAVSVACNGWAAAGKLNALADSIRCSSAGFARNVVRCWEQRREWYPDEHPIRALHRAHEVATAAVWQATKRQRGSRIRRG